MFQRRSLILMVLPCVFILNSCMAVKAGITVRRNGSGRIQLEYRVSRIAESLGRLDGNESRHTVPAGRADFNRTLNRLPGLRLISFSEKQTEKDIINRVEIEFDALESLLPFLDAGGKARLAHDQGKNRLSVILTEGFTERDGDLAALVQKVSEGYEVAISFSAPDGAELFLTNGKGEAAEKIIGAKTSSSGKTVSVLITTAELLSAEDGLGLQFVW
ncbi:MAG: hypothetical protein LBN21_11410 [Treponema sp.]|jgi:hypothetical protein|nr:hypothetical protein [Treponema sp.]